MRFNAEAGKITALLATTALACGFTGLSLELTSPLTAALTSSVLGGISVNVASSFIDKLKYEKLREWFITRHPDELNHDLQKALIQATIDGINNVAALYKSTLKEQQHKKFSQLINDFKERVKMSFPSSNDDIITKKQLTQLLYNDPNEATAELMLLTPNEFAALDSINTTIPFSNFFNEQILKQFKLSFSELLKDKEYERVWIAFQRFLMEDIRIKVEMILEQQNSLQNDIKSLKDTRNVIPKFDKETLSQLRMLAKKLSNPITLQPELTQALDRYIHNIKQDLQLLLQQQAEQYKLFQGHFELTQNHYNITQRIDQRVSILDEKLGRKLTSQQKIFTICAVIAVIIIIILANNITSQPANAVFTLTPFNAATGYPPLSSTAKLSLYTDNKLQERISGDNKVTFLNIKKVHVGEFVKVELEDEFWKTAVDTIQLAEGVNNIDIIPNDALAKLSGWVKLNYSTPINMRAELRLGNDTVVYTKDNGSFEVILPIWMRKPEHRFELYYNNKFIRKDIILPSSNKPIYIE